MQELTQQDVETYNHRCNKALIDTQEKLLDAEYKRNLWHHVAVRQYHQVAQLRHRIAELETQLAPPADDALIQH